MKDKLIKYGAVAGALVSVAGLLAVFDVDIAQYRPALAGELYTHVAEYHEDKLDRLKKEYYIAKSKEHDYQKAGEPVPKWLIDKIVELERKIKKLEKE